MTWDDIVEKYPGKWIFLDNIKYEDDHVDIESALVKDIANDNEVDDKRAFYRARGEKYVVRRTTDDINVGVITCENYRLSRVRFWKIYKD